MNTRPSKTQENNNHTLIKDTGKEIGQESYVRQITDNRPLAAHQKQLKVVTNTPGNHKELNPLQNKNIELIQKNPELHSVIKNSNKHNTIQRFVIQLQYDADGKVTEIKNKKEQAIPLITAEKYDEAFVLYQEIKGIIVDIHHRNACSPEDKVYNRHKEGALEHLRALIKTFNEALQNKIQEITISLKNNIAKYNDLFGTAYSEIVNTVSSKKDTQETIVLLKQVAEEYTKTLSPLGTKSKSIRSINSKILVDKDLEYFADKKNERVFSLPDSKMTSPDFTNLDLQITILKQIDTKYKFELKKTLDFQKIPTEEKSEEKRNSTIVSLLAGSEEREKEIAKITTETDKQIIILQQINKTHKNDPLSDVNGLITSAGIENLPHIINLLDKVGAKGSVKSIKDFYESVKLLKGFSSLENLAVYLNDLNYLSIDKFTDFAKEAGKFCSLDETKERWNAAVGSNTVDEVILLFNEPVVKGKWSAKVQEISLAFAKKTGKSKASDWGKLLSIDNWELDKLIELSIAFDKNDGNASAALWAKAATGSKQDTTPDEIRGNARLNSFANDEWYNNYDMKELSSKEKAQKKYTQLLYALMGDKNLTNLGDINFSNIKGDFLSMLVFFHRHIAPFQSGHGQGFDLESSGESTYSRSDKTHPLNLQYTNLVNKTDLLQPLNTKLFELQQQGSSSKKGPINSGTIGSTKYWTGKLSLASAGLPSNNLKMLQDQQDIVDQSASKTKKEQFLQPVKPVKSPDVSRTITDNIAVRDSLAEKLKTELSGKVSTDSKLGNFHDGLLQDRGQTVTALSSAINSISGGTQTLSAIGSEGHPSLLLLVPGSRFNYKYNSKTYSTTDKLAPDVAKDFNSTSGQEIKITVRGSFGFQRPTIADTGDSIRIWPGYAPVETLLPGLKTIVKNLRSETLTKKVTNTDTLENFKTATTQPVIYIEALKTAMRHAFIVLEKKIVSTAPEEKKRVYAWLKERLLIKLKQSAILLDKAPTLYDGTTPVNQKERNKHYQITADMTDKLQEYSMLYTAATLDNTTNPNQSHTETEKFKNSSDDYEKKVVAKLNAVDYRLFYLDSGEQSLITAGILANRFKQGKDEADTNVPTSKYVSINPYFEIGLYGGAGRSNLERDDNTGKIVHADLSPVITEGRTTPKPKSETQTEIKSTWQNIGGTVKDNTIIPIFDITNSSIDEVVNFGTMPDNYIIVESLTKHQQLGADKFIMGRLIAISNTAGTKGKNVLVKTNFLDLAQKIVGPVSNEAYNPLLHKIRANMDKALYTDDLV